MGLHIHDEGSWLQLHKAPPVTRLRARVSLWSLICRDVVLGNPTRNQIKCHLLFSGMQVTHLSAVMMKWNVYAANTLSLQHQTCSCKIRINISMAFYLFTLVITPCCNTSVLCITLPVNLTHCLTHRLPGSALSYTGQAPTYRQVFISFDFYFYILLTVMAERV